MKDETKEILNKLLLYFKESNINNFGYEEDKLISYEEAQILLDYITNLQEYYNDNVNKYEELVMKYSDLQSALLDIKEYASNRLDYYEEMRRDYMKEFDGYAENDNENILDIVNKPLEENDK